MENITSLDIFLVITAAIFLILWLVYLVRILLAGKKIKDRNRVILRTYEKMQLLRADQRSLRERYDQAQETIAGLRTEISGTEAEPQTLPDEGGRAFRQVSDALRASRLFTHEKVSREEVCQLVHLDKKELEALFKQAGTTLEALVDDLRLEAVLPLLREAKNADVPPAEDGQKPVDPVEKVILETGYTSPRALSRQLRETLGFPLDELMDIL